MKRHTTFTIGGLIVVLLGVGTVWIVRQSLVTGHSSLVTRREAALYYCPMHPTYTSDRPGDCPICNMRLVKREEQQSAVGSQQSEKSLKDICYLHHCPMLKAGQQCPMLVVAKEGETVTCPVCGVHVVEAAGPPKAKKILYWTDPMIPGFKAQGPGKSPMGMELVPVYEEAAGPQVNAEAPAGYAPILLTPQKQQLIGVKTAAATRRRMVRTIRTVGQVAVDETRRVHVHPKVEGWLREIYAKYEGDVVSKGQPLFSFYSPDFVATQQEYLTARKTLLEMPPTAGTEILAAARDNVAAGRQRLLWWDITEEQIQALEQRGAPADTLLLTSPIDGIVLTKHVFPGEFMERGSDFYHLVDLSTVWVNMALYESDLPFASVGQTAALSLAHDPANRLQGTVTFLSPTVNPDTRTATARVQVPNPEGLLRPGAYVTAELMVDLGEHVAVPAEAILDTGTRRMLFVDLGRGVFEPREVTVGARADGDVEVTSGVAEGERVLTSGNFLMDSESRLKAALEGLGSSGESGSGEGAHHHGHQHSP
jgi:RND family efflux transporter MFP subunit